MKFFSIIFLFLSSLSLHAREITLRELIDFSLRNSPDIQNLKITMDQTELDRINAKVAFLPTLDLSTEQGIEGGSNTNPSSDWTSNLTLTASETLYNNGTFWRNYKISKLQKKAALYDFQNQRDLKALDVARDYLGYLNQIENLEIVKEQVSLLENQFSSISNQYKQGMRTRIDYLRFQSRLKRAQLDLRNSQVLLKNRLLQIKRRVGWKEGEFSLSKNIALPKREVSIDTKDLIYRHPLYLNAKTTADIRQINYEEINRDRWPVISLESNMSYTNSDYLGGQNEFRRSDSTNYEALLKISWNIWDWGTRKNRALRSKYRELQARNTQRDQELSLTQNISTLVNNIERVSNNLSLSKELKKLEEGNYLSLEVDYRNGRTDFLNLVNALNDLASAKREFYRNQFQLSELLYELYYYQGNILEKIK